MDQEWFEMEDIRRRKLDHAVWIPLRACQYLLRLGRRGHLDHREEFFGVGSIAIPLAEKATAGKLNWGDIGLSHSHRCSIEGGRYFPSDVFTGYEFEINGVPLVLAQDGNRDDPPEWHLHQDFVIALNLKREGDNWLAIDEGYIEVARLTKEDGRPALLQVRAEHLKDYLCARAMALYVSSFRSREETLKEASHINWCENPDEQNSGLDRWEGRKIEIHEGGHPLGSSTLVMHVGRKNVDVLEDVPRISPSDETVSESWTVQHKGEKLIRVLGEFWRNEWVEPAQHSPRVRGDELPSSASFIVDASGSRKSADDLRGSGSWLWFMPDVIPQLCNRRGGSLCWYTRETGGVTCSPSASYVHFGVNRLGRVNVYAKDIGYQPHWAQTIWAGFNVGPEGGVSKELLQAQAEGSPANTQAPEEFLPSGIDLLNEITSAKFGFCLFRAHDGFQTLVRDAHRFRSRDEASFFALAKDLARLTADAIDSSALQKIVAPPLGTKWGSLKSLEHVVAVTAGVDRAHSLLGPLFGIYELRHADAHLPSGEIEKAVALVRVDRGAPFVIQGCQLLCACVSSLHAIADELGRART